MNDQPAFESHLIIPLIGRPNLQHNRAGNPDAASRLLVWPLSKARVLPKRKRTLHANDPLPSLAISNLVWVWVRYDTRPLKNMAGEKALYRSTAACKPCRVRKQKVCLACSWLTGFWKKKRFSCLIIYVEGSSNMMIFADMNYCTVRGWEVSPNPFNRPSFKEGIASTNIYSQDKHL